MEGHLFRGGRMSRGMLAPPPGAQLVRGAAAGLLGGAAMAMFTMVVAELAGYGLWSLPRAITAVFFGEENLGGGLDLVILAAGMAIHMMLSAMFGFIYALLMASSPLR